MPLSAPIIAALISAGVGGTEMGLQASGAFQPSTSGQMRDMQRAEQEREQKAKQAAEQQAFKHFAPDVQGATGGALGDSSFSAMVAEMAGQPGDIGTAQSTIFGNKDPGLATGIGG